MYDYSFCVAILSKEMSASSKSMSVPSTPILTMPVSLQDTTPPKLPKQTALPVMDLEDACDICCFPCTFFELFSRPWPILATR